MKKEYTMDYTLTEEDKKTLEKFLEHAHIEFDDGEEKDLVGTVEEFIHSVLNGKTIQQYDFQQFVKEILKELYPRNYNVVTKTLWVMAEFWGRIPDLEPGEEPALTDRILEAMIRSRRFVMPGFGLSEGGVMRYMDITDKLKESHDFEFDDLTPGHLLEIVSPYVEKDFKLLMLRQGQENDCLYQLFLAIGGRCQLDTPEQLKVILSEHYHVPTELADHCTKRFVSRIEMDVNAINLALEAANDHMALVAEIIRNRPSEITEDDVNTAALEAFSIVESVASDFAKNSFLRREETVEAKVSLSRWGQRLLGWKADIDNHAETLQNQWVDLKPVGVDTCYSQESFIESLRKEVVEAGVRGKDILLLSDQEEIKSTDHSFLKYYSNFFERRLTLGDERRSVDRLFPSLDAESGLIIYVSPPEQDNVKDTESKAIRLGKENPGVEVVAICWKG